MQLKVLQEDPFNVLSSIKPIVENLKFITISEKNLDAVSKIILEQLEKGLDDVQNHFGKTENLEDNVQLIFLEDVVNFCFWQEKGKEKWKIEFPKGYITTGGWYSLTHCFKRAIFEKLPILDPNYLENLTLRQVKYLFRGVNNIEIPLIKERLENLKEAGIVLNKKYKRQFINLLEEANFDAVKIVELILRDFPSFRDISKIGGKDIVFLKRAQICAQDFSYLSKLFKIKIKNMNILSAFADYKIPQMLRNFGVLSYEKELSEKIDNYVLIPKDSLEEIEIRAVTIWCIELIRQKLEKYNSCDIDNALWLVSQDQKNIKPYHRTYTIFY